MNPLEQLVRLHGWTLEEHRRKLAGLEALGGRLAAEILRLDSDLEHEMRAAAATPEGGRAFPAYAALVRDRRGKLAQSQAEVAAEIDRTRSDIESEFQELKKYEQAVRSRAEREHKLRARRERVEGDELGIAMFRRRV